MSLLRWPPRRRIRAHGDDRVTDPLFDAPWYLDRYPDVRALGVDPYRHFRERGVAERREPNSLFDTAWYLQQHPDLAASGLDPLEHYLRSGGRNDPSPRFSAARYLAENPDVRDAGMDPLLHYLRHGRAEGREVPGGPPSPRDQDARLRIRGEPAFRTWEEYLRLAMTDPWLLRSPFDVEARRILDVMGWTRDRLAALHRAGPQDELVSVIIPTYQRSAFLERSIASVLRQSYRSLEVVIVDDGSTDETPATIASHADPRVRSIRLPANAGHAVARNRGLAEAAGTWVCYLDAGDWWDDDFVLVMRGEAAAKGYRFAYSAQLVLDPPGPDGQPATKVLYAPFHRGLLDNTNFISMITVIHRRELVDLAGPLDASLRRLVDWELFLRLSAFERPLAVPAILSTYDRRNPASVSRIESREAALAGIDRTIRSIRAGARLGHGHDRLASAADGPAPFQPVTIVIPSYEAIEHLRACIDAVRATVPAGTELVVVDNASGAATRAHLAELADAGIRVIQNHANLGFTNAVNQGIAAARPGDDIVLLNNDALVTPGWLDAMRSVLARHPDVGIVAPRQVLPGGHDTIPIHVPGADASRDCDVNLSAHHRNVLDPAFDARAGLVELTFAPFFCVLIRRSLIDTLGPLDHVRAPHYHSDRTWCDLVRAWAGSRIVYTPEAIVRHFVRRSADALAASDPALHHAMTVTNRWKDIMRIQGGTGVPASSAPVEPE